MENRDKSFSSSTPAQTFGTLENSVTTLNQVLVTTPEDAIARQALYDTMQKLLRKDAFLSYQGETDLIYEHREDDLPNGN